MGRKVERILFLAIRYSTEKANYGVFTIYGSRHRVIVRHEREKRYDWLLG